MEKEVLHLTQFANEAFLGMIMENTPAVYAIIDEEFNVVYVNPFVEKIIGFTRQEMLGTKCYDRPGKGAVCHNCGVVKVRQTGQPNGHLHPELDKYGNQRYNYIVTAPLLEPDGTFRYVMEIVTDRTEETEMRMQMEKDFEHMVHMLTHMLSARDPYTGFHSDNVKNLSLLMAQRLCLSETEQRELVFAGHLHDVGKVGIPDAIILKPGPLTREEFLQIKRHPEIGDEVLKEFESFVGVRKIVRHHHERMDGKGYPDGLAGEDIPYGARIAAIADTFDAMTTDRPYRKAMSLEEARDEIVRSVGTQLDPQIAGVFVQMIDEGLIEPAYKLYREE